MVLSAGFHSLYFCGLDFGLSTNREEIDVIDLLLAIDWCYL